MQDSRHKYSAPEGAACSEHADRPADFTCPRCGAHACLFCWHPVAERCDTCLKRDPAAAAPALPWETLHGSPIQRYVRTLVSAFAPVRTAPAFARPGTRAALRFFLLSALPFAALAGIIPNTKTLMFGGASVTLEGNPTATGIALDVARAMGLQVLFSAVDFLSLAVPYTSLVHSYSPPERRGAAWRVLLYRSWLAPVAALIYGLGLWLLPVAQFQPLLAMTVFTLNLLLLSSLRASARLASGIGVVLSFVVVAVPLTVCMFVQLFLARILDIWLPLP
jgi:hypothetical protein